MTSQRYFLCLGFLLGGIAQFAESLFINGCPMFGCRPSGSFSFDQHLPGPDAAINWVSDLKLQPLPKPYGCVTDSSSIICLNNDVFSENQAFIQPMARYTGKTRFCIIRLYPCWTISVTSLDPMVASWFTMISMVPNTLL
ncbi:hypothetical protein DPMN_104008 [Dreissena polymorpha]|uniref:Uncharacterized protein n=1 Tax=Dreissena polymorpha TaxID=45954 RepID=A0A9D4HC70_DREPO|nr:hypothetical protein DPMN_104008 [Dreissena polymorpha]